MTPEERDRWKGAVGKGWETELVMPFLEALAAYPDVKIGGIKEKFGGLRISAYSSEGWVEKLIESLEEVSWHVCEGCGKRNGWGYPPDFETTTVRTSTNGWQTTVCQRCATPEMRFDVLSDAQQTGV